MIGTNLNLDLPSLSDTMATIVAKLVAALSTVEASFADKVTPGGLNINSALDLRGNALVDTTSIQLAEGNTPSAAGSIYYLGGEFFAVDATGVVQLTAHGAINAAGVGAIVGDYGGVNPARVTYDNASAQYRFTSSPGVWADLVARNLILEGTNGSVTFGVDAAINSARIFTVKSLPSSGVSVLVYNAATSTVEDGQVTAGLMGTLQVTNLTTTADRKHTDAYSNPVGLWPNAQLINGTQNGTQGIAGGAGGICTWTSSGHQAWGLRTGDRIKTVAMYWTVTHAGNYTFALRKYNTTTQVDSTVDVWQVAGGSPIANVHTIAAPVAIGANELFYIQASNPSANAADRFDGVDITWDHP